MELSADLFSLVSDQPTSGGDANDRRKTNRAAPFASATIYGFERRFGRKKQLAAMTVGLKDLSPGGVCLLQYQPLKPGDKLICELPAKSGGALRIVCQIRWCRPVNDQLYAMGAAFLSLDMPASHADAA